MSVSIISHQGKEVIYVDYQDCQGSEERLALLESSFDVLLERDGEQLILVNVQNQFGDRKYMQRAKEMEDALHDKVKKRAVLGIEGIKKVLLMGLNKLSSERGRIKPFDNKEAALDYLVTD